MPNSNGTQTIDADPKQAVTVVDSEAPGSQSKEEPGKRSTTRRKRVLLISAAMLVAVAAGYFVWNAFSYEDTDDAQVDGHVMPLSARVNGNIEQVLVIEGQLVHTGDVLVTIDPQDYKIAAAQAHANLADAEATSASLHWNVPITSVTVQSNLDSAKTAVANAEAAVKASEQNYESAKGVLVQARGKRGKERCGPGARQATRRERGYLSPAVRPGGCQRDSKSSRSRLGTGKRERCRTSRAASSRKTPAGKKRLTDCGDGARAGFTDSR